MSRTSAKLNASNTCLCNSCGEYFSTIGNFDRHRKGRHGIDRHCVDPETVGLVIGERGGGTVWKQPNNLYHHIFTSDDL